MKRSEEAQSPNGKRDADPATFGADQMANPPDIEQLPAIVPTALPQAVLASDALAKRGLSELAKAGVRIEVLPRMPKPLDGHCVVSDERNERVLLFGGWGNKQVWSFDFADPFWTERMYRSMYLPYGLGSPRWNCVETRSLQPDAVGHPSVVLDSRRSRVIYFAGWPQGSSEPVDDLYTIDIDGPSAWVWRYVEHTHPWPASRNGASLVLDEKRDRCLLFGGDAGQSKVFSPKRDLWSLDLKTLTWQQHKPGLLRKAPTRRWLQGAVLDSARDRMIVLGGAGYRTARQWMLKLDSMTWDPFSPRGMTIPLMEGHVMVHSPASDAIILHGGLRLTGSEPHCLPHLWRWDLSSNYASLIQLPAGDVPAGRFCHAGCYCRHRRALFLAGGKSNSCSVANYYETDKGYADTYLIYAE